MPKTTLEQWYELDRGDPPRLVGFEPMEPGDASYHRDEIQLYWPFVGGQAWALGIESTAGGECEPSEKLVANL